MISQKTFLTLGSSNEMSEDILRVVTSDQVGVCIFELLGEGFREIGLGCIIGCLTYLMFQLWFTGGILIFGFEEFAEW